MLAMGVFKQNYLKSESSILGLKKRDSVLHTLSDGNLVNSKINQCINPIRYPFPMQMSESHIYCVKQ